MKKAVYKRVLIKVSGEALACKTESGKSFGVDPNMLAGVAENIKRIYDMGVEIAVVVGGGNFWRGAQNGTMDRTRADHIGMLATVMNSLALADAIEQQGISVRVQTAIEMREIAEQYIRNKAVRHLEKGRVTIFGCGTGNPFFTTDTAAALRAVEIGADVILLAKNVDGVYDKDPVLYPDAKKYSKITHQEVLQKNLKVMDSTAASLCRDNQVKIHVFGVKEPDSMVRAVCGDEIGTLVE
ncbi:MAG: UMP kinase [Ruminococcaceae bacterium]|nr:UMP kinase [Oscillospiraceae bacterium]